jgi:hypothetical protein
MVRLTSVWMTVGKGSLLRMHQLMDFRAHLVLKSARNVWMRHFAWNATWTTRYSRATAFKDVRSAHSAKTQQWIAGHAARTVSPARPSTLASNATTKRCYSTANASTSVPLVHSRPHLTHTSPEQPHTYADRAKSHARTVMGQACSTVKLAFLRTTCSKRCA